jgi:hypothetical protein
LTDSIVVQTSTPLQFPLLQNQQLPSALGHKQIYQVKTLEPDRQNKKSQKQISREFLREADNMVYTEDFPLARQLVAAYLDQQQKLKIRQKKAAYAKKRKLQQRELAKIC